MSEPAFGHLRALIIEDNNHMRALLRSLLGALGIPRIDECNDGASGYTALREHTPDFVLTDLSMKPIDGLQFTRLVRHAKDSPNPYIPIIMVTGHTERASIMAARDAGVTEILAKPITVQNLLSRLTEIVERPRSFVRCGNYFGPDRRRRKDPSFKGPYRRQDDLAGDMAIL